MIYNQVTESSQFGYDLNNFCKFIEIRTGMWPVLAVERNVGSATIFVLNQLNYPRMYRMPDFTAGNNASQGGIGWLTTGSMKGGEIQGTRRKMLDDFALTLRQGQVKIYDEQQILQLKSFVVVKGRAQARSNTHDDLTMSCYSDDTEVLTENGWKKIVDVGVGEKIPSMDTKTKQITLATNTNTYIKEYRGDMYHFDGRSIDLLTTPNHRMVVAKSKGANQYGDFEIERADVLSEKHFRLLNHAIWSGKKQDKWVIPGYKPSKFHQYKPDVIFDTNDFLSLLGFYLAEGCVVGNKQNGFRISLAQREKSKGYLPTKRLLEKMGIKYTYIHDKEFCIYNTQLALYIQNIIPKYASNKRIPREVLELHPDHLIYLYEFMMLGDGYKDKTYITNSEGLKDDFCELISKLGWYTTYKQVDRVGLPITINPKYFTKHKYYAISIGKTQLEPRFNHHSKDQVSIEKYNGKITCLSLDRNQVMLVRRNNKTCWSGNTCGAWQVHLTTPSEFMDDFSVEDFKKEQSKWRFK